MTMLKRLYSSFMANEHKKVGTPIVENFFKVNLQVKGESGRSGYLELNNIHKYSNQNCMVTGGTGSGKTVTITEITKAYLTNPNTKAIILDYKQDYREHAKAFNAEYENINDVSIGYNPLYIPTEIPYSYIRNTAESQTAKLKAEFKETIGYAPDGQELPTINAQLNVKDEFSDKEIEDGIKSFRKALRDTVYGFSNKISSVYPIMGGKQKGELRTYLNDYIIETMGANQTPSVRGLYRYIVSEAMIEEKGVGAWVYEVLEPIEAYSIFTHEPVTFHEYMEKHSRVIIDVSELDIEYQLLISLFIIDDLKREMMEKLGKAKTIDGYRQMKYILVIDEAFKIVKSKNNSFKDFIQKSRQYGVGIILGFQSFRDATQNKEIDWEELLSLTLQGRSIKEEQLALLPLGTFMAKSSRMKNVKLGIVKTT